MASSVYMIGKRFIQCHLMTTMLEALPVDNGWAGLVVFLLADPHLLEGGERGQDGATDPYRVFPLWGSDDLDLHCAGSKRCDLLLHSVGDTREHCGASGQNSVSIQVFTDVNIALHDGVVGGFVDTSRFHTQEGWLEEGLWTTEPLVANGDDLTVGQLVALLQGGRRCSSGHLLLKVKSNIAELLLDVSDDFSLSCCCEGVTTLCQDLHEIISEVTTSEIKPHDGVGKSVTFIDGYSVGDTITRVQNDTSGTTRSVQGQHSLDGHVHSWRVECLEHDLGHLFTVGLGIEGSLCQEDGVFLWGHTELVVEGVMPDLLHVVPVGDDAVFDGVLEGEDTSLGLSFITHVAVFLTHTDHHTLQEQMPNINMLLSWHI